MAESLDREFYTVKELAELFRVTPLTIYRLANRGEIASYKIGRATRIRKRDVEAFLGRSRISTADGEDGNSKSEQSV